MTVLEALKAGAGRLSQTKRIALWILMASLVMAFAPMLLVSEQIEDSLGKSQFSEDLADGYSDRWFREFEAQADGLASTFHPTAVGVGALLDGFEKWLAGTLFTQKLVLCSLGLAYALLWVFAAGGCLAVFRDRYSPSFSQLIAMSGRYFGRFLRLFAVIGLVYATVYYSFLPLLNRIVSELNREVIDERMAFASHFLEWIPLVVALLLINIVSDYTKILIVTEHRSSVVLALLRSVRLIWTNRGRVVRLYAILWTFSIAGFILYWLFAPGAGQDSWFQVTWALLIGQIFITFRISMRLMFFSAQLELSRSFV